MVSSNQSWPLNTDYLQAIKHPDKFLKDSDLQKCSPITNPSSRASDPMSWQGNFAIVFHLSRQNFNWAVKCFTAPTPQDAEKRYTAISNHLSSKKLHWLVNFQYQNQGLMVKNQYYPIVKMEWVEGDRIDRYITNNLKNRSALENLFNQIEQLQQDLHSVQIAHGDLQHGNILVTQSGEIKLVDYDGMYVPALRGNPPNESGHRNYRHPNRSSNDYNEQLDDFSFDVILLSLAASIEKPNLWKNFHTDDENLLFREADFKDPNRSPVFKKVNNITDPTVQFLYTRLLCRCNNQAIPIKQTVSQGSLTHTSTPTIAVSPNYPRGSTITNSGFPPGFTITHPRRFPLLLIRLLVLFKNQFLILGTISLGLLIFYGLVQLWNTHNKLTPMQTLEKFYEVAPSNSEAALNLTSESFRNQNRFKPDFWKSVKQVELLNAKTLEKSETNTSIRALMNYVMKDGTTICEPRIIEFVFDPSQNQWLVNNDIKLLDPCPNSLKQKISH
jgi:serine/threonine protein kinase